MVIGLWRPAGRVGAAVVIVACILAGCGGMTAGSASGANTAAPGPYRVSTGEVRTTAGDSYQVFRPASYRALSFPSPIVTWGNGTGGTPDNYATLLTHLASWGFTVIASTLPDTGSGQQILAGARYLVGADRAATSVFHGHLDTHEVAAMGHSQGATGAMRAGELGGSLISTVVTFSLPWNGQGPAGSKWDLPGSLGWSGANPDCPTARACWPDPSLLHQPTFVVGTHGPLDAIIAAPGVERCYFEEVHAPAALGLVRDSAGKRADHLTVMDSDLGGSPEGLLGYVTAWLLDQLRHNWAAAADFSGRHPSLLTNPDWPGSAVKSGWSGSPGCS